MSPSKSRSSLRSAMRIMIRAANTDRTLMENTDWQSGMIYLNEMIKESEPVSNEQLPVVPASGDSIINGNVLSLK